MPNVDHRFLTDREVAARYGVSVRTIHRWIRAGSFPPGAKIGPNTRRWYMDHLEAWDQEKSGGTAA